MTLLTSPRLALVTALSSLLIAGCVEAPKQSGLADVMERPAERSLLAGMRAYDDGQYPEAEQNLKSALGAGLSSPRDRANANKLLAFIFCTSERLAECEWAFRAAKQADPTFALSRSEAGHPLWGPVYRKVTGQ